MLEDLTEAPVLGETEAGPLAEGDIDDEGERDDPEWVGEEHIRHESRFDQEISDSGDDQRFRSQNERDSGPFFDLGRDEFFGQGDHDEKREYRSSGESGALVVSPDEQEKEYGQGNDGERNRHAREIEEAEASEAEAGEHADDDDGGEDRYAILELSHGEESEGDDGRGIDTEGLDPDDLAKNRHERRDDREHEEEGDRENRNPFGCEILDERVIVHKR